jgi:hypothetical protein
MALTKTRVVNIHKEPYDVSIMRPSIWGNPFSHKAGTLAKYRVKDRAEAVARHKEYLAENAYLLQQLHTLKDKTLG